MGKKWRVIGGVSGFVLGAAIAVSGVVSIPLGFAALMAGGALGLLVGALAFVIYRHPVRFRLQTLMIIITILATALGTWTARVDYLRRMAAYHEREAKAYVQRQPNRSQPDLVWVMNSYISALGRPNASTWSDESDDGQFTRHCVLAGVYRRACYRPWTIIDESKPPEYSE